MKPKKRRLILIITLFLFILLAVFLMNTINKKNIKEKFRQITVAEGMTIAQLLDVSGIHLAEEGFQRLTAFLDRLYRTESIVYIGLFDGESLVYLLSRFEGFFPVVPGQPRHRILDTQLGKIFEISSRFSTYRLYIGFDYQFLTTLEQTTDRSLFMVMGVLSIIMAVIIFLLFYFDKKFFHKELELVKEKQEKERFKEFSILTAEIAHEIKNPLNSIYLSFNTLEKYCTDQEDALFYRKAIKGEIKRISHILESYTDLSKEVKPQYSQLDLQTFSDDFRLFLKEELQSRGVELNINIAGDSIVEMDENLLKQILLNLVKNALEAEAKTIDVTFGITAGEIVFQVSDNGKEIPLSMRESIFKPYISGKTKGMGLGLHICRRLVIVLGGKIHLLEGGAGDQLTRFQLTLPRKPVNQAGKQRSVR